MEEFANVNAYINKNGKKFVVFKTKSEETFVVSEGLLNYVLNNAKQIKKKEN